MARHAYTRGCLVGNLGKELGALPDGYRERLADVLQGWQDRVADCLRAAQRHGELSKKADCDALAAFYARWQADELVMDKWFTIQATASRKSIVADVRALYLHPAFDLKNPNRVRALVSAFASANPVGFHAPTGDGYRFLADAVIALDPMNPQVAARIVTPLGNWRRQDKDRQARMRAFSAPSSGTWACATCCSVRAAVSS